MSERTRRRSWADEGDELVPPELRGLLVRLRRQQISSKELVEQFGSDSFEVSGRVYFAKSARSAHKLFLPDQHGWLAGGVVGVGTPIDLQSDSAGYSSPARPWVTGVALPPEPAEPDAAAVLSGLRGSEAEAREAVAVCQTVEFTAAQSAELVPLLRNFIDRHRTIAERDAMVVTAAAIRGYIAHLPAAELDAVAELLDGNDMPSALENETVKMVARKLTAVPPTDEDQFPRLAEQVASLATSYVGPRLVNREYYGATALNSVLASALLRTSRWAETLELVARLPDRGFRLQVGRRAAAISAARAAALPEPVRAALSALADLPT